MKKSFTKYITLLILAPLLLLQGCWLANMPVYVPPHVPAPPVLDAPPEDVEQTPSVDVSPHGRFTLRYEPANTLNPIRALNRDNISLSSFLYESLFILDENLRASPLLCESWETEDNITFSFTIFPDIAVHDGSTLTADDVAYSLRQARQRGRHRSKLHNISTITSDGDLTITITLSHPNARFTRLLDIPIIKADTIDDDIPPGTGPYVFPNPDNMLLLRFARHRDYSFLPVAAIYLQVCNDGDLTELFDQGIISLLWDDPTSSLEIRVNRDHEPRYYNTTSLQFLGFNSDGIMRNADLRRAIGCAIERQFIVENIMSTPRLGQTVASPVAISPMFDMYDSGWESRMDPAVEMAALLERAGIADYNFDGFLEEYDGGTGRPFTLIFTVNVENSHKVAAAEHIAASLRQVGFNIDLRVQSWDEFIKDLQNGNFDIYYGEVQIGADFDFSPLLLPDDSAVNYGKTASSSYEEDILSFLAAKTREEVSLSGQALCDRIRIYAPFVPILYKRHAIYTPLGLVSGAAPSQSGIFINFKDWAIDLESPG